MATAVAAATAVPTVKEPTARETVTAAATAVPAATADEVAARVATNLRSGRQAVAKQWQLDPVHDLEPAQFSEAQLVVLPWHSVQVFNNMSCGILCLGALFGFPIFGAGNRSLGDFLKQVVMPEMQQEAINAIDELSANVAGLEPDSDPTDLLVSALSPTALGRLPGYFLQSFDIVSEGVRGVKADTRSLEHCVGAAIERCRKKKAPQPPLADVIDNMLTTTIGTLGCAGASASQLVVAAHQFGMTMHCSGEPLTQASFDDSHGLMDENKGFVGFLLVCEAFNLSSNVSVNHFVALVQQPDHTWLYHNTCAQTAVWLPAQHGQSIAKGWSLACPHLLFSVFAPAMVYDDGFDVRCSDAEVRVFHHMLLPSLDTYPNISLASTATEPAMARFLAAASALAQQLEPFQGFAAACRTLVGRGSSLPVKMEVDRILCALNMLATVKAYSKPKWSSKYYGPYVVKAVVDRTVIEVELLPSSRIHPRFDISKSGEDYSADQGVFASALVIPYSDAFTSILARLN
eukprot:SAG25_NODE_285_length_10382_cov_55.777108_6_plen_518_part_00